MRRAAFFKLQRSDSGYPSIPPYDPPEVYPEFSNAEGQGEVDPENCVYPAMRQLLIDLGLDRERCGSSRWNPLKDYVHEGGTVVIKPNLVLHRHARGDEGLRWTVTHPSVVRALIDYSWLAVGHSGRVTVADTPLEDCHFSELVRLSGYEDMLRVLEARGGQTELIDLRAYRSENGLDGSSERIALRGDPQGYTDCDLAQASMFAELETTSAGKNYYTLGDHTVDHLDISCRTPGLPTANHSPGRHIYRVANTILKADFTINVAKLKTHKFAGVTLCLKNAIGICNGKEFMPHRRPGAVGEGGDSYPNPPSLHYQWRVRRARILSSVVGNRRATAVIRWIRILFPRPMPHLAPWEPLFGDWSGNDTIWRTTVDLNRIWLEGPSSARERRSRSGKMLCVIDGVIGMDHEGPMAGMPVNSQVLVMAKDPVAADTVGAILMGFDPQKIPTIRRAGQLRNTSLGLPLSLEEVHGNVPLEVARSRFVPNRGWMAAVGSDRPVAVPLPELEEA